MFFTCKKHRGFHRQLSPQLSDASEMVSSCSQLLAAGNDAKVRIYDSWLGSQAHLRSVAQSFETMLGVWLFHFAPKFFVPFLSWGNDPTNPSVTLSRAVRKQNKSTTVEVEKTIDDLPSGNLT